MDNVKIAGRNTPGHGHVVGEYLKQKIRFLSSKKGLRGLEKI
jgi:hypothetical protein